MTNQSPQPATSEPAQAAPATLEPVQAAPATLEPVQAAPATPEPAQPDYAAIIAAQSEQINQLTATVTKLISGGVQIGAAPPPASETPEPEPEQPAFETVADLGRLIGKSNAQ